MQRPHMTGATFIDEGARDATSCLQQHSVSTYKSFPHGHSNGQLHTHGVLRGFTRLSMADIRVAPSW